eukprot:4235295-Prymnesium_polylepis.1
MQQRKDAETELAKKQSQVDRLGGHVANAMRESARLAAQTAKLRQALASEQRRREEVLRQAEERLAAERQHHEQEARDLKAAAIKAREERKESARQEAQRRKEAAAALKAQVAENMRLGSKVAAVTQAEGRAVQQTEALQSKLAAAKEERQQAEDERGAAKAVTRDAVLHAAVADRKTEGAKATSQSRLAKVKALQEQVTALQDEMDELMDAQGEADPSTQQRHAAAFSKLQSMPTWQPVRQSGSCRGGMKLEHEHRVTILEQHANGTPPSAIGRNIVSVVKRAAPWLNPVETTKGEIRKIGFELTTVVEALSARPREYAEAFKVRLLGFDETSDLQKPFITSNVQIQPTEGAELQDLILKAAYLSTKGGESEAIVDEIEGKCFARLRDLLRLWKKYHEKLFPGEAWS